MPAYALWAAQSGSKFRAVPKTNLKGEMSYDEFKSKLVKMAKRKGLQSALPKTIKDEFKIKASLIVPEEIQSLLAAKASKSETSAVDLLKVFIVGYQKCDSFFRPGKSDLQLALARVNRFIKTKIICQIIKLENKTI